MDYIWHKVQNEIFPSLTSPSQSRVSAPISVPYTLATVAYSVRVDQASDHLHSSTISVWEVSETFCLLRLITLLSGLLTLSDHTKKTKEIKVNCMKMVQIRKEDIIIPPL